MIIIDFIVERCEDAAPPDFASQYKKQDTIDAKIAEWKESGWQSDPANCLVREVLVPNPENVKEDIHLPFSPNLAVELVNSITGNEAVVCDDFTEKTCVLINTILHMVRKLREVDKPSKEEQQALTELPVALAKLYAFKLDYISRNYVHGNCHNIAKTLKWDGLPASVLCQRLNLEDGATRVSQLAVLAEQCGVADIKE